MHQYIHIYNIIQTLEAVEVQTHLKDTVVTLVFETDLPVGEGSLSLDFRGDINNQVVKVGRIEEDREVD